MFSNVPIISINIRDFEKLLNTTNPWFNKEKKISKVNLFFFKLLFCKFN